MTEAEQIAQAEGHIRIAMSRGCTRERAIEALQTVYPDLYAALAATEPPSEPSGDRGLAS